MHGQHFSPNTPGFLFYLKKIKIMVYLYINQTKYSLARILTMQVLTSSEALMVMLHGS